VNAIDSSDGRTIKWCDDAWRNAKAAAATPNPTDGGGDDVAPG
jgi:hypothetical protein